MAATRICSIPDCSKAVNARGLCGTHYQRWRQYGDPLAGGPVVDRQKPVGPCSAKGCNKPAKKRGMCDPHYRRFMAYGDPLAGATRRGEPLQYFNEVVVPYTGKDCLIWPFAKASNGYAHIRYDGKVQLVSRLACEARHGAPASPELEAAHACGQGHRGCVNPSHLYWATGAENAADKLRHGTHNRGERSAHARLTATDVITIRGLAGKMFHRDIAAMFGITPKTASAIIERRSWKWLP